MLLTVLFEVFAYGLAPGDVSRSQSPNKTMDLLARHMPTTRATPTPLPDRLHLALVGKDDGSLQAKLPQIIIIIITIIIVIIIIFFVISGI